MLQYSCYEIPQILTPILPDHEFYLEVRFFLSYFLSKSLMRVANREKLFFYSTQGSLTLRWRNYKRSFTLKTHQIYPVHTSPDELKPQQPPDILDLCLRKIRVRKITRPSRHNRFRNAPFSKCFPSTRKQKTGVFKFLLFEDRFRKARFS